MRVRGPLRCLAALGGLAACALAGFVAVAAGPGTSPARADLGLPPLPTSTTTPGLTVTVPGLTTVSVPTTTVHLPTTVPLPTTTTVPPPTTSVHLPTTAPLPPVPPPPTTVTAPSLTTAPVATTSPPPAHTTTVAGGGGSPGSPPASGSSPGATAPAGQGKAGPTTAVRLPGPASGPALEAVRAGAMLEAVRGHGKGVRARARARKQQFATIHASRVAARSPGLAAFYAGLEKALAQPAEPDVAPRTLWPVGQGAGGVLSRTGALALALALLALALLLAFAVVPRLAAVRVMSASRASGRVARESLVVTLATAAVCAFLAVLLVHAAL